MPPTPKKEISVEDKAGIVPSHGIAIDVPSTGEGDGTRPATVRHMSTPAYESPIRHHQRKQSSAKEVKETLHARSEYTNSQDEGGAIHRINQYIIKQEIGRGSFGAVHLAVDQHGIEYAVKEFSKSRLRKRAQSNILRRPHGGPRRTGHLAAGVGFNSPMHRNSSSNITDQEGDGNSLFLIKEEIAVMKKLNHDNLVSLIEVLDDPNEDSLYMVLEMCKKGVIMKVGMEEQADPYDDESCRCWFRDLILGIEYLHAQGVVHRDIKPDNLLLTEDDVLKIVDFGVSEIFEKHSDMTTAKSAGSPAFLPPELCVAKHGGISGKAADIWSMGVTLYCLRFGRIPFEQPGVLQLYESIKNDDVDLTPGPTIDDNFKDLMERILDKNPVTRIKMDALREHPWVTRDGKDPLLSAEENTANLVEPPTEEEKNQAITGNLSNILVLMKAVKRFKNIVAHKRPSGLQGILGKDTRMVQPPLSMSRPEKRPLFHKTRSVDTHDRRPIEQALVAEGVHRDVDLDGFEKSLADREDTAIAYSPTSPTKRFSEHDPEQSPSSATNNKRTHNAHPQAHRPPVHASTAPMPGPHSGRGQAHDPLSDHLYLGLGPGGSSRTPSPPCVSESPPAAETNIYETAYDMEIQRLRAANGRAATLFLTRRVERNEQYQNDELFMRGTSGDAPKAKSGFARVLEEARMKAAKGEKPLDDQADGDVKMNDAT
ncbi:hypothetical protein HO133_000352 [Letharia lupina]|uniref:Protein kinase domain-containing protein n=1 Tax=Letharia lupina TaxID=560253 RepID=A0A8H6CHU7_9LECA|nr:uncharacterized protein HO133_000352 [Letharia lupina]KAF6223509.1 hypothetical protein HO133_000352 [Letharia lupina]